MLMWHGRINLHHMHAIQTDYLQSKSCRLLLLWIYRQTMH